MLDKSKIQGTEQWLELRRHSIGASDAAATLGISPWKTPHALWSEKLGLTEGVASSYAMQRGIALEPEAIAMYEKVVGEQFLPAVIFHPKHHFIMASLDGMNLEGTAIVEVKCPGKATHEMALRGEIPDHYMAQLQHQMMCTKLQKADYYSYDGTVGVRIEVERDEEYIAKLLEAELAFWELVKSKTPPPLSEKDCQLKDGDPEWFKYAEALRSVEGKIKDLEEEKNEIKQHIMELSEGRSCKGCGVTVYSTLRQGSIDYSRIEALKDVNIDSYRKPPKLIWSVRLS